MRGSRLPAKRVRTGGFVSVAESLLSPFAGAKAAWTGRYELYFTKDVKGAALGKHNVYIDKTPGPPGQEAMTLPAKYSAASALTADVKQGANTFDFKLTGK